MFTILLQAVTAYGISYALWKVLRRFLVKSPLDNLPGPPSQSLLFGVFPQIFNPGGWEFHKEITQKYGGIIKIKAFLGENQLYVFDPKALYHIAVKDQYIYEETSAFYLTNRLIFGPGLLGTLGDHHRKQRKMLNPVFNTGHIREMIPAFYDVSSKLRDSLAHRVKDGPREIEVLSWMTRTALELVGRSGLGFSFESLTDDVPHPYSTSTKLLLPTAFMMMFSRTYLLPTCLKIGTPKFRRFIMNILPWKNLHKIRDMVDVIHNTSVEIFEAKKKALEDGDEAVTKQINNEKDIISILMRANMSASEEDKLSREELLAQMSTLTFAAMDTTSSALSRTIHLLSYHKDVQSKLRQEIMDARRRHGDRFDYDELVALPYLDAICRETLRLYPPISCMQRTTKKDIVLPLSTPVRGLDGQEINEVPIPKNTNIIIGILASNQNPEIWGPDSYEWKPERWLSPLPTSVFAANVPGIYSNMMTFFGGGRACIGFKFSQLEMKVVLSLLIGSFEFSPSVKEISWQMYGIAAPTVVGETGSQLPMVVKLVEPTL